MKQSAFRVLVPVFALLILLVTDKPVTAIQSEDSPHDLKRSKPGDELWLLPLPGIDADPAIPDSKSVLRYDWGQDISSHLQISVFLESLAKAAPDRTRLVNYGQTYEGRALNYLVISSPGNIARLDEIQANIQKLADPRSCDQAAADEIAKTTPAILWLAYCVHGNEISPSDSALLTAWHLLADRRAETQDKLKDLVVIIDPLQNPDGRDRFVNVFRETRGLFSQSNPASNEHTERWPGGRFNHYWFDMNRDWFRHSQREVRGKVAAFLEWYPQIYVDSHEMGANSNYYFSPPADPKNPYLLPTQHEWFNRMGMYQAGWFDKYGFGYVTREIFDAFYPGYGSEWPTLQGGLGILWEQASARGLVVDREDETQLTYHDGVRHNYISGLATIEFAATNHEKLLLDFYHSRQRSVELGSEGPVRHYFLLNDRPDRAVELAQLLMRNGIEVRKLDETMLVSGKEIASNRDIETTVPAGSFHVPVAQGAGRLLRALMDQNVEMDEKFLRRQLERNELGLADEIYDVTAWSLPLSFDVSCIQSGATDVKSTVWDPNAPVAEPDFSVAKVAYLIPGTDGAMQALSWLIQQGVRTHVADEAFRINDRDYARGTLIAKVSGNGDNLDTTIREACRKFKIEVVPADSAYVQQGVHMGGPDVHWVRPPKILLVVHEPTSESCGHTWHLFDEKLAYPTTRVKGQDFSAVNLADYNTIILPDGNYSADNGFGKSRAEELRSWIAGGGTLVTMRGGTAWAADPETGLLKNLVVERKVELPGDRKEEDKIEKVRPDNVPGAFFRTSVFQKHWVTFGYRPELDIFYSGSLILSPTGETEGRSLVSFAAKDKLLASGFCWPTSQGLLADSPYAVYRGVGDGHVIAFTDDPNFRAMYPALQRLFINAVMFGAAH